MYCCNVVIVLCLVSLFSICCTVLRFCFLFWFCFSKVFPKFFKRGFSRLSLVTRLSVLTFLLVMDSHVYGSLGSLLVVCVPSFLHMCCVLLLGPLHRFLVFILFSFYVV